MFWLIHEIRKRFTIPIFLRIARQKRMSQFDYPPKDELLALEKELRNSLPSLRRVKDLKKEHETLGKLQLIAWLTNQK